MAFNTATKRKVADLILLIYCCVCGCLRLGMLKIRIRFGGGLHCRHFAVVSNLKRRLQISCLPEPQLTDNISNNIVTRRYRSLFLSSRHSEGFFFIPFVWGFFFNLFILLLLSLWFNLCVFCTQSPEPCKLANDHQHKTQRNRRQSMLNSLLSRTTPDTSLC